MTKILSKNKCSDLFKAALNGDSIRIFLRPDETVKQRVGTETYIESLPLPNIIMHGKNLWACQELKVELANDLNTNFSYYSYSNFINSFAQIGLNPTQNECLSLVMTTGRYAELEWVTVSDYECIWSYTSSDVDNLETIQTAIRAGKKFKIAVLMPTGSWIIRPIYFPFAYSNPDRFEMKTNFFAFSELMLLSQNELLEIWQKALENPFDSEDLSLRELGKVFEAKVVNSTFTVRNDGTLTGHQAGGDNTEQAYIDCMIFASK